MVISDLNYLEETSERVIGGLSVVNTGNVPVELEICEPIYGEPVRQKDGATSVSVIGCRRVKIIVYPTNVTAPLL